MLHHLRSTCVAGLMACALLALAACTPALNWREVQDGNGQVKVLLPCKPDHATRQVTLGVPPQAQLASLQLHGCEATDMQFTWGQLTVPAGMSASQAMASWRLASLASVGVRAEEAPTQAWPLAGASANVQPVRTRVQTSQHRVQWVWFVHGDVVYQAGIYAGVRAPTFDAVAEVYFSGIQVP